MEGRMRVVDLADGERLLAELVEDQIQLPEYPGEYSVFRAPPDGQLMNVLAQGDLVRMRVRPDLRSVLPPFARFRSRIATTVESQPPHLDHPHRPGDLRRYNLFWAEYPREGASTYFIPRSLGPWVADFFEDHLRNNPTAWAWSERLVAAYQRDPRLLSRYVVPERVITAYVDLVRWGRTENWRQLSVDGRLTVTTRIMSNNPETTRLVGLLLRTLADAHPNAIVNTSYPEPTVIFADDTALYHGRFGQGDSGTGFFRTWLLAEGKVSHFRWDDADPPRCGP